MSTARLEAFSDAVLAIIITIMILEIHPPATPLIQDWVEILPKVAAYVFSFIVLAIYWNNHHHLIKASKRVTGPIMWANMHLLFWLSLVPVATAWVGEHGNYREQWPVMMYALIGFAAGTSYYILTRAIIKANPDSKVAERIGRDKKGLFSQFAYTAGIVMAFFNPIASLLIISLTAIVWVIPDRRLADLGD